MKREKSKERSNISLIKFEIWFVLPRNSKSNLQGQINTKWKIGKSKTKQNVSKSTSGDNK